MNRMQRQQQSPASDSREPGKKLPAANELQTSSVQGLVQLQKTLGNQAVSRMLGARQLRGAAPKREEGVIQRMLVESDQEGFLTDTRNPNLYFQETEDSHYLCTYNGVTYSYIETTKQFIDPAGYYFDPYSCYSFAREGDFYMDGNYRWYTYQDHYYLPSQSYDSYGDGNGTDGSYDPYGSYGETYQNNEPMEGSEYNRAPAVVTEKEKKEAKDWLEGEWITSRNVAINFAMAKMLVGKYTDALNACIQWNRLHGEEEPINFKDDLGKSEAELRTKALEESSEESTGDEQNVKEKEKEKGRTETFILNGKKVPCKLANTKGGYHNIYEIVSDEEVYDHVENSRLLVRKPKNEGLTNNTTIGMENYHRNSSSIEVPRIFNQPKEDNFYVVEKIDDEYDPSEWANVKGTKRLKPDQLSRLKAIRRTIEGIVDVIWPGGGTEPISDFRPANVRFKGNKPVLIDFSEPPEFHDLTYAWGWEDLVKKIKRMVNQFAGQDTDGRTEASPAIVEFLTKKFPKTLTEAMKQVGDPDKIV